MKLKFKIILLNMKIKILSYHFLKLNIDKIFIFVNLKNITFILQDTQVFLIC